MLSRHAHLRTTIALGCIVLATGVAVSAQLLPVRPARDSSEAHALSIKGAGFLVVLAWNDLGMHCYNNDAEHLLFLPPYNTLWAQVIQPGNPPQVVRTGIIVSYSFPDNTYSAGKTNFWSHAQKALGLAEPLPPNIGLTGKGLSGDMDAENDHFVARGIPLTEYSDSDLVNRQPYQLATIIVRDATSGAELARNTVVAPVSSEMSCDGCHSDDGDATTGMMSGNAITPTGSVDTNILAMHDLLNQSQYPAGHDIPLVDPARQPVLCAECHSDNALGLAGIPGISSLSNAMHRHHAPFAEITPDVAGCQKCHPGSQTKCLRDVMYTRMGDFGFGCLDCHGGMASVSRNPAPWLNEPRCDSPQCHGTGVKQSAALYRFSKGHGGVYCEGCHDSTHAIAPSREPNDAIKFVNLQGHSGTLSECGVCHAGPPTGTFRHVFMSGHAYLPSLSKD
jgi:hypothetical protein